RAAHAWLRDHDPRLAAEMSGALFHAAYSSLWNEPAEWSAAVVGPHSAMGVTAPLWGAVLMCAGASAHRGDLHRARIDATAVAGGTVGRVHAMAVELLADIALYEGDLELAARLARELRQLGEELGDLHAVAFGAVDAALARTY